MAQAIQTGGRKFYRMGAAVAVFAGLFQVWINLAVGIVGSEDNQANQAFFGVVITAAACAFTARLAAEGMARAMLATAGVQAFVALALATAPSTARVGPDEPTKVVVLSAGFIVLWLVSALLFHRGTRAG